MSARRRPVLPKDITVTIEKLSHDGRGIARIDGKTTFVHGALSGEEVVIDITSRSKDYDEGRTTAVLNASPLRVEPICPNYTRCGGCSLQHLNDASQIQEKEIQLIDLLTRVGHVKAKTILPPLTAKTSHYRNKARLSAKYVIKNQVALVGFRERANSRYIAEIDTCKVLNAHLDKHIPALRALIASFSIPTSIAQIELAAGDDKVALIFRHLEPLSDQDLSALKQFADDNQFVIYLQPGGFDSVKLFYPEDNAYLTYRYPPEAITYHFHPTDFTQVNGALNTLMLNQALALMDLQPDDVVLDLFCGLGNFTLPMAKNCAKVVGVEGSQTMVDRALMNAGLNNIQNVEFYAKDLEKPDSLATLLTYGFTKVLIDPPRTGALAVVEQMAKLNVKRIVYVSCNPATLARDADVLVNKLKYRLVSAGVMDMFPHTAHVESIAVFERT